ncbi:hypothetical protein [Nocardioides sp.]|uniref:hypothetical protein n=1 Tax=Nocardioides sp. TaxID=35761 RepID=UPI0035285433
MLTNPDHYSVVFENDHVRVLEYVDQPGDRTTMHAHPGQRDVHAERPSRRRLYSEDGRSRDVELSSGTAGWLPAQRHAGHNVGPGETHVIFVELKQPRPAAEAALGPTTRS